MPAAVAPLATAVFWKATAIAIAKAVLINYGLGLVSKALGPKSATGQAAPINVTVRNSTENRKVIFGKTRASGTFVFYACSGTNNKYLHYVIAYAGHQCNAIRDVWLDSTRILDSEINSGTGAVTGAGTLSAYTFIWRYAGTSTQSADSTLISAFPGLWTSAMQLKGIAYIHVRMERSDEGFPQGAPQDVTALIEGAKLYDPRQDSTNGGSGSQRASDPSTWTFPTNPSSALVLRWIITGGSVTTDVTSRHVKYGMKDLDSRVNDAYTISAANVCDETLSGSYTTPTGDQYRYSFNGELSTGQTPREWMEAVLATMAGAAFYVNGKWRMFAGDYDAPVHDVGDADVFGDLEIQDTSSAKDRYNAVAATYRSSSNDYVEMTTQFRTDTAYETEDGSERIPKEIDLTVGVTDDSRAQRLCEIDKRKSRLQRVIKIPGTVNLLKIAPWETFTFSNTKYGWSNRVFRCLEREFDYGQDAGAVKITAREESSAVWTDMVTADYSNPNTHTPIGSVESPDAPSNLTTNGQTNGILVAWTKSPTQGVTYELEESTSSSMSSPTVVYAGADNQVMLYKAATTTYYYRCRALRSGQYSSYLPASNGVSGAAAAITSVLNGSASPASASVSGSGSSQSTSSVTVTPAGGTPAYTYAWTWLSGGSGITIGSASSATTSFSATGLSNGETRTGVARCTITDSVAGTATVDVSVSISRTAAFTVTASPSSLNKTGASASQTTASTTATPSGGTPSYTYSWAAVSGGSGITINSATSATTTFTGSGLSIGEYRSGTYQCTVTDSASNVVASNSVNVSVERTSSG